MERPQPLWITDHATHRLATRWAAALDLLSKEDLDDFLQSPSALHGRGRTGLNVWLLAQLPLAVFVEDEDGNAGSHDRQHRSNQQIWATPQGVLLVVRDRTVMTVLPPGAMRTNRRPDRSVA